MNSSNTNVTVNTTVEATKAAPKAAIETIVPRGFNQASIELVNNQIHQLIQARDAKDNEKMQYLLGLFLDQMYDDPYMQHLATSHPLCAGIEKSVTKLRDAFMRNTNQKTNAENIAEMCTECLHEWVLLFLDGSFKARENRAYISTIQNCITFNGTKPGILIKKQFDTYNFSYAEEEVQCEGGKLNRKRITKTGRAVAESLSEAEINSPACFAVTPFDNIDDIDIYPIFADIILRIAKNRLLVSKEMIEIFLKYCAKGDAAFDEDVKAAEAFKANVHNRAAGFFSLVKKSICSDSRLADDQEKLMASLLGSRKTKGGLKRMLRWAAQTCSPDAFTACFGDRMIPLSAISK